MPESDTKSAEVACCLDLRGLSCPLPVLQTNRTLKTMMAGERLRLYTSDPRTAEEIPALCRTAGHQCLERVAMADGYSFLIQRGV